jgi:hypothetical protein
MNSQAFCNAAIRITAGVYVLAIPGLIACSDSPSAPEAGGALLIRVAAKGLDYPATFRVQLNTDFTFRDIKPNKSAYLASLFVGTYTVTLTQLPPNCTAPETSRTVNVEESGSATVQFDVTCVAMFGALRVSLTTSGIDFDPTGYRLQLSSGFTFSTPANGTAVFDRIPGGSQTLNITGIASNCSLASSPTHAITISVGGLTRDTARASFDLTCSKTEKFAFRRAFPPTSSGHPDVVSVSYADGSEVISITGGFAPAWSPNGSSLAFEWLECDYYYSYGCDKQGLAALNTETAIFVRLTRDATDSDPAWRPTDGAVIAFGRGGMLYLIDAAVQHGNAIQLVTSQTARKASQPSWSPDAAKIAFACEMDNGWSDICAIGADGTGFVRLTNDSSTDANPEWSPDGKQIAFSTSDGASGSQIALINSTGGAITRLTAGKNPAWSRDGTRILFEGPPITNGIFMITLGSGMVTRLTTEDDHDPAWRP